MVPLNRYAADRMYVVGERYKLAVHEERSGASHRHWHACIDEAFNNLPDHMAKRFATVEHYRKYLLIRAGHYTELADVCDSYEDATRTVMMARKLDDYAIAHTEGKVVTIYRAKSTSYKELSGPEAQKVKQRTLELAAADIGVTVEELARNAGTSA